MAFLLPKFKGKFPGNATMQDTAFQKYGGKTGVLVSIASFIYPTNTMEMMGIGVMLHLVLGMPYWMGVTIGAIVVLSYTITGGLWAVTITDFALCKVVNPTRLTSRRSALPSGASSSRRFSPSRSRSCSSAS